ncbi:DUF58 domain-containing protein [Dictyobacter formicarum]|uniref:DUF58 domain-containing protein n=1 Tax=Dictyobacter formicarum TaxID=2778368 RepID=A0ABQ3VLS9_9CHLR|nr:DUF58 domain-containing protein [Dictyobacter formicarum]GHO86842.1 hypothetical protein KSZ_48480 [Dictyobacter formicarum]
MKQAQLAPRQRKAKQQSGTGDSHINRNLYLLGGIVLLISIPAHIPLLLVCSCIFLCVLLITDIWATYCLHEVRYQRHLSETRVLFGEDITLSISIENAKLLPLPVLQVNDSIPRALPLKGQAFRKTLISNIVTLESLFSLRWYERVTRTYTIQCINRGVYTFGPAKLHSGDLFGFISRELQDEAVQHMVVYPLVVPISSFHLPSQRPFGDYRTRRRFMEDPSRVIGVRDYAYGDSLRRVDWKATARTQELQSKIYESTTTYSLSIFLNSSVKLDNYYSIHPALQELAICAAASISNWGLDEGYTVGLYANTPMSLQDEEQTMDEAAGEHDLQQTIARQLKRRTVSIPPARSEEQRKRLMEALARIQPHMGTPLEETMQRERAHLSNGATVIVITNVISERLMEIMLRMQRSGHAVSLLLVGDNPPPTRIAGFPVYYLGGEETWDNLQVTYGNVQPEKDEIQTEIAGLNL